MKLSSGRSEWIRRERGANCYSQLPLASCKSIRQDAQLAKRSVAAERRQRQKPCSSPRHPAHSPTEADPDHSEDVGGGGLREGSLVARQRVLSDEVHVCHHRPLEEVKPARGRGGGEGIGTCTI